MVSEAFEQRFGGIIRLYGRTAASRISRAHLLVVGIGGVGSWCAEALARSGCGSLTLIDPDDVALSNSNRQLHTLGDTLEQSKVAVMAARIRAINPDCQVQPVDDLLVPGNLERLIPERVDLVLDCIDQVRSKAALIAMCRRRGQPIITTGGAGGMVDPARIEIADLSRTHNDPLAARLRATLRRQYGFPRDPKRKFGVDCVFSSEQPRYPTACGEISASKPGQAGVTLDCNLGYGAATMVTASFGMLAAARAIERIGRSD